MAHKEQIQWCLKIKEIFPTYFYGKQVLDVGALDVNGNNRHLFVDCEYIGLDIVKGKNVDVVCVAHEYKTDTKFDVVLSTNALEHDIYYEKTLNNMISLLSPNGLMFFSCASKWKEHGTKRRSPSASGTTKMDDDWAIYYKNLSALDILSVFTPELLFKRYKLNIEGKDLRFWGIKND